MKKTLQIALLFAGLFLGCGQMESQNANNDLVGTWTEGNKTFTLNPDGTGSSHATIKIGAFDTPVSIEGSWMIADGYLYTTVKSSTLPKQIPVGFKDRDKIVSIDQETFHSIDNQGKKHTYHRRGLR